MNRRVSGLHPTFQSWIDMPTGPKGEKRPRDTNQLAKLMVDILTGEVEDRDARPKSAASILPLQPWARRAAQARAASMTHERRAEIAKKAAATRWAKKSLSK